MPTMLPGVEVVEQHVPAWKKLGLKLKFAKDEPVAVNGGDLGAGTSNGTKRKLSLDEYIVPPVISTKKPKTKSFKKSTLLETNITSRSLPLAAGSKEDYSSLLPTTTPVQSHSKHKSVSFTPETKTQDGDSIKQLYNTWLTSHLAVDPNFDPSAPTTSPALKTITPPSIPSPSSPSPFKKLPKKKKRKRKSKSTLLPKTSESTTDPLAKLPVQRPLTTKESQIQTYLTTHHLQPTAWKFSKTLQTALLRSLFSPSLLHPSNDTPLLSYLHGLQGKAVRARVRTMAQEVRAADEAWLKELDADEDTRKRKRTEYEDAVARTREALKRKEEIKEEERADREWESRIQKRRRAELLIWSVGETEQGGGAKPQIQPPATKKNEMRDSGVNAATKPAPTRLTGPNGKAKRKRKIRATGVPDDVSSSSSSSSGSSSESGSSGDSDDDNGGRMGTGFVGGKKPVWEETSSEEDEEESDDSGSSSESESAAD